MFKTLITILMTVALSLGLIFAGGCNSDAMTGSALGSLAGAGIGQLAGGDTEATLIGAAIGAGAGYIFGNESDRKKNLAEMNDLRTEQNTVTVWITNSNGSQRPVRLAKSGPNYVGPRGEIYNKFPSEDQLRTVYGF